MTDKQTEVSEKDTPLFKRMMEIIKNPKPKEKPPYTCPKSAHGKKDKCAFPNCLCEWYL